MAWQVIPPNGGWHYINADGTRLDADSHDSLVKTLASYRTDNALPLGDPETDVDTFICSRWPGICGVYKAQVTDVDEPPKVYGQRAERTTAERIGSWASNRYSRLGSIDLVDKDEAERRTTICANCPQNYVHWKQDVTRNCPPCAERLTSLDATMFKIRKGKDVSRVSKIGACRVLGHDNQTAVWLDDKSLQHAKHYQDDLPESCWLKQ